MIPALIAAGVAAVGGVVSQLIQQGRYDDAQRKLAEARAKYAGLSVPEFDDLEQQIQSAQMPTRSALEDVAPEDPRSAAAQQASIDAMGEFSRPGMTADERALMSRALGEIQRRNAADRASLANAARSAGGMGAGQTLAMGLQAQQARGQQESDVALQASAQAQQRALAALRDRYSMARSRGQDVYGRDRDRAQAVDALRASNARFALDKAGAVGDLRQRGYTNSLARLEGETGLARESGSIGVQQGQALGGAVAGGSAALGRGVYGWLSPAQSDPYGVESDDVRRRKATGGF